MSVAKQLYIRERLNAGLEVEFGSRLFKHFKADEMRWTQIKQLYLKGLSITEVANELNMSRGGVGYAVKRLGISRRHTKVMKRLRWKPLPKFHYPFAGDEVVVA